MEFTSPPNGLAGWMICAACVMWIAGMAIKLARDIRGKPGAPPNEQLEQAHQHLRKEFDKERDQNMIDHNNIFSKLGGVERGVEARLMARLAEISIQDKTSRSAMHEELTEVGKSVAGLETATEFQNQRLVQIDAKLDRLGERIKS